MKKILPEKQIIDEYINGASILELSKKYTTGQTTLRNMLIRNNVKIRGIRETLASIYIPETEKENIEKIYNQGKTANDIAKLYKCKRQTIMSFMKTYNIKRRHSDPVYDKLLQEKEKIISLYNIHKSLIPIANEFGCSSHAVKDFMDKENINRKRVKRQSLCIDDVEKMYNLHHKKKYTLSMIGDVYGCSPTYIRRFLDSHKVKRRTVAETSAITAQSPETIKKQKRSLFTHKPYTLPSGKTIKLQGYEPQFLDYCFDNNLINESKFNFDIIRIPYKTPDNKKHYYYPDFYISSLNLIIEIKSTYILKKQTPEVQQLKEEATKLLGYKYILILDNNFNSFTKYLKEIA